MKCDECLHSRLVISENGYHSVCCLLEHESRECIFGEASHFVSRIIPNVSGVLKDKKQRKQIVANYTEVDY